MSRAALGDASPLAEQRAGDPRARLAAWRAQGAESVDPVRFRFLEAFAARAAAQDGDVRRVLDARLATLLAAYDEQLAQRPDASTGAPGTAPPQVAARRSLHELVERLDREGTPALEPASASAPPSELKALRYFRSTWSRLSADQRLTQALAKVPENAGPLNSHHLVHRALMLMRELSPDYLARFIGHVDALLWLDQLQAKAVEARPVAAADAAEKKPRGRAAPKA